VSEVHKEAVKSSILFGNLMKIIFGRAHAARLVIFAILALSAMQSSKAEVIASAGTTLGNSNLAGPYYVLWDTLATATTSNSCSPIGLTLQSLPSGITVQTAAQSYTCAGGYSMATLPDGTTIQLGLLGLHVDPTGYGTLEQIPMDFTHSPRA
jgi:hypothetical protein